MWVRFLVDHAYKPVPNSTTDYKAGMTANLPHDKAQALIDAGKAEAGEKEKNEKVASDADSAPKKRARTTEGGAD